MREKADFVGQPLGLQGPRLLAQKNIHKELQHISAETETDTETETETEAGTADRPTK